MKELTMLRIVTGMWLTIVLILVALIPAELRVRFHEASAGSWGVWQWIGLWVLLNGVGLAGWCANLFNVEGRGTPLPMAPPRRFLMTGPYRYVRNPMLLGLILILIGEVILFRSRVLALYTGTMMIVAGLYIRGLEEPGLVKRFGQPYQEYCQRVPRWIPRRVPPGPPPAAKPNP